jgi:SAM-dependent methyltransferase
MGMNSVDEFGEGYAAEQFRRANHPLRRFIKNFYLKNILRELAGPTLELGCGAGQLLRRLPPGSLGLEVNQGLISRLQAQGLPVRYYDALADNFRLSDVPAGRYVNLVLVHVLEHFDAGADALRKLLLACEDLSIQNVLVVVPGESGFNSDPTHKTFVTEKYIMEADLNRVAGFQLATVRYFPHNRAWLGKYFAYHELMLIFRRHR